MSDLRRVRGLCALVKDAVDGTSRAVETVHLATARRTFTILEQIPPIAGPSRLVHTVHDGIVNVVHRTLRGVNGAIGGTVDAALSAFDDSAG
jgi:hypothetical protein